MLPARVQSQSLITTVHTGLSHIWWHGHLAGMVSATPLWGVLLSGLMGYYEGAKYQEPGAASGSANTDMSASGKVSVDDGMIRIQPQRACSIWGVLLPAGADSSRSPTAPDRYGSHGANDRSGGASLGHVGAPLPTRALNDGFLTLAVDPDLGASSTARSFQDFEAAEVMRAPGCRPRTDSRDSGRRGAHRFAAR